MADLLQIQRQFSHHIFNKFDEKILEEISCQKEEALSRLNIYRNNVLGNFESVLSSIFPVTKKILGKENFELLVGKYCKKFPSKSGDLNEFGKEFPELLTRCQTTYLKDLARLELFYHQSYFAAKAKEKFDVAKIKNLPAEEFYNLIFTIDPSCVLLASKFAVFSIWKSEKKIKNYAKPQSVLICSDKILKLSEEEFLFLALIQKQKKLFEIYKTLRKKTKKEVARKEIDIGKFINRFVSSGAIIGWN